MSIGRKIRAAVMALMAIVGVLWLVFNAGQKVERAAWVERERQAVQQAQRDFIDDLRLANQAATRASEDARAARDFAATLQTEIRHARVALARPPACGRTAGPAVPRAGPDPAVVAGRPAAHADAPSNAAAAEGANAGDPGITLTAHALRLWNSALAGEHVPAGACRSDDPTSAACAADTAVTLDDAWANHTENAASCRADRARLQRLIEYLQRRERKAGR